MISPALTQGTLKNPIYLLHKVPLVREGLASYFSLCYLFNANIQRFFLFPKFFCNISKKSLLVGIIFVVLPIHLQIYKINFYFQNSLFSISAILELRYLYALRIVQLCTSCFWLPFVLPPLLRLLFVIVLLTTD